MSNPSDVFRAAIPAVSDSVPRPLWSVMIPTYHCAGYLRETLTSVLMQDPGSDIMQIEVIDDHSTADNPRTVVEELGGGRVTFFQHPIHVGITENLNTCLRRSRGQLVHILHGDDCVRNGFYRKMQTAFQQSEAGAAFCRHIFMDADGHWTGLSPLEAPKSGILSDGLARLAVEQRIMTPSIVVRRDVYERYGGFDHRLLASEDWEMWIRIAASAPIWYEVEPLAIYRMHAASNTGRHLRSGGNIRYTCQAIDIFRDYLPDNLADTATKQAKATYAFAALTTARTLAQDGDMVGMLNQCRAALMCSRQPKVLRRMARITLVGAFITLRQRLAEAREPRTV